MITEGYLARHYHGRRGGRDFALLDVAQDYALKILSDAGLPALGLTFKGGTALRKFRVGNRGRFSTDLDFAANEEGMGELIFERLHGASLHDVLFRVEVLVPDRRALLKVDTPLGSPQIDARIEVKSRAPYRRPELLEPIPFPVHEGYEFRPVSTPVMALEETLAEKLAALRRRSLVRDLYDLALFAETPFDDALVRRLTHLKVYTDVVEDALGRAPFDPASDIVGKSPDDFEPEDIGLLAGGERIPQWIDVVSHRYGFVAHQTDDERRWAQCNRRDLWDVRSAINGIAN